jgi:hypothetical protein
VGGRCGANGGEEERRRRIDNLKMDLLEIGLGGTEWICLA